MGDDVFAISGSRVFGVSSKKSRTAFRNELTDIYSRRLVRDFKAQTEYKPVNDFFLFKEIRLPTSFGIFILARIDFCA